MNLDDIAVAAGTIYVRRDDGRWQEANDADCGAAARLMFNGERLPTNSPDYEAAVDHYLRNERERFNYDLMRFTYLDATRFSGWVRVMAPHRRVEGSRVLVSGCGSGGSMVAWWAGGAEQVLGLEVDRALTDLATLRVDGMANLQAEMYDGKRIPADDGSIDIIESVDVLEHVPWPETYIAELARVLRPGGAALLVTPNRMWPIEQHVNVIGPPWMSIGLANRLFPRLADLTEGRWSDLAYRIGLVPTIREVNVSFALVRRLAKAHGLRLELLDPGQHHEHWPLPRSRPVVDRMNRTRLGKFLAPTRHLTTLLWKDA